MEARIKDLLEKINYPKDRFSSFNNANIKKIIVEEDKNTWNIYLENDTNIKYDDLKIFLDSLTNYVKKKYR
mgnify:CR=1 FL=1